MADQYVSKLDSRPARPLDPDTIREPLSVLCKVGILHRVSPAVYSHIQTSAKYKFSDKYPELKNGVPVNLSPTLASKLDNAEERKEKRLNKKRPYREQLFRDLNKLTGPTDPKAKTVIEHVGREKSDTTKAALFAIHAGSHRVSINERGQITTTLGNCPKELRKVLILDGSATSECDISFCHSCFLPRLIADRMKHAGHTRDLEDERQRLIEFLSDGDFYSKLCEGDPTKRDQVKGAWNTLLNETNEKCLKRGLYLGMKRKFPLTFGILEDIKRDDHRTFSKMTQRWTSDVINAALMEVQRQGIPAIPLVDSIIVPEQHREQVCELIGREMYRVSGGVCCKVDGIRYTNIDVPF